MAVSYMDFSSPNVQFTYDLSNNNFYTKDSRNLINALSVNQLNTLGNASLLDIYLSAGNVIEPHIHQNASEIVYCISGAAVVSLINPFTKKLLNFPIQPGQVANVPQGWWHYEIATVDNTHLLAIFDAPVPEFIPASDMLRLTPPNVLAYTYCLNEAKVKETLAPITETVVIGPPKGCKAGQVAGSTHNAVNAANTGNANNAVNTANTWNAHNAINASKAGDASNLNSASNTSNATNFSNAGNNATATKAGTPVHHGPNHNAAHGSQTYSRHLQFAPLYPQAPAQVIGVGWNREYLNG